MLYISFISFDGIYSLFTDPTKVLKKTCVPIYIYTKLMSNLKYNNSDN